MKWLYSLLILSIIMCQVSHSAESPLTVWEAYQIALKNVEAVEIQGARLEQTKARVRQTKAALYPQLLGQATALRQQDIQNNLNDPWRTSGGLRLNQSLYRAGVFSSLGIAKSEEQAQEQNVLNTKDLLYLNTALTFYNVLASETDAQNIREAIKASQERVNELSRRVQIGRSKQTEATAARTQLLILESQHQIALRAIKSNRNQFSSVTGIDPDFSLASIVEAPTLKGFDHYANALKNTPRIETLRFQLQAAKKNIGFAKSRFQPNFDFFGNYFFFRTGSVIDQADWDLGFIFSIPLYSGGAIRASIKEAKSREEEIQLALNQELRVLLYEVRLVYQDIEGSLQQIRVLENALKTARENFRQQENEYRYGLATNLDVLDALTAYLDTKRTLDRVQYDTQILFARLQTLTHQIGNT